MIKEDRALGLIRLQMTEEEYQLLSDALNALLKVKQEALEACREAIPLANFREQDFGIDTIQKMLNDINSFEGVEPW